MIKHVNHIVLIRLRCLEMKTHFISNSLNADSNKDKAVVRFDEFRMCIILLFYSFSDQLYMSG